MTTISTLTPAEQHRRRDAVHAGEITSLTVTQVASQLGIHRVTLTTWLQRHMPDHRLPRYIHLLPEDAARRVQAVRAGEAAGATITQVAAQLGIPTESLRSWLRRHIPDHTLSQRRYGARRRVAAKPKPPTPAPPPARVAVTPTVTGWRMDCWPCSQHVTRTGGRARRRCEQIAVVHARMHHLTRARSDRRGTRYETTS